MTRYRHTRFLIALVLGLAAFLAGGWTASGALRFLLAGAVFFTVYLALTVGLVAGMTVDDLRRRAAAADEGLPYILAIVAASVIASLAAVFVLIADPEAAGFAGKALALATVPLGWLTVHTLASFHYANLFYAPGPDHGRGLGFPGTEEPGPWDFLYYSFVVGMTAQVSDVTVCTGVLRKTTLAHGIASFFYNTVIVALVVNAAVGAA